LTYNRRVGNLVITSFFIVRLQDNYEVLFPVVWCCMGYASKGEEVVGELERTIGTPFCFGIVEVGFFAFNVVFLERMEHKEL
jgi:hypothetical protein